MNNNMIRRGDMLYDEVKDEYCAYFCTGRGQKFLSYNDRDVDIEDVDHLDRIRTIPISEEEPKYLSDVGLELYE